MIRRAPRRRGLIDLTALPWVRRFDVMHTLPGGAITTVLVCRERKPVKIINGRAGTLPALPCCIQR